MTYDPAFKHCIAGMYIGRMFPKPMSGEFGAVLSVGDRPGTVEDGIRHRHVHISYLNPDLNAAHRAADWVEDQLVAERTVLVRSEGGRQRPGLVVALVVIRLGGSYHDAMTAMHHGDWDALSEFRFQQMARHVHEATVHAVVRR